MKYTINEFRKDYPNEDACLDTIFNLRYAKMPCCPQCQQATTFKRIAGRRSYQCSDKDCQYQLYPTAGTVFEKTRTSLVDWFYVIYLMTSTRNGVSGKEIQRQLGVTYKCAWRMGHQIRLLMANGGLEMLKGTIEVDETYIGGKPANRHANKQSGKLGRGIEKVPIVTMVERNGAVRSFVVNSVGSGDMYDVITKNVEKGSKLITDGFTAYKWVGMQYEHIPVKHNKNYITYGEKHTNSVGGFFSHLKRTISGTHIHVSRKHLQKYANECSFRYTFRGQGQMMFKTILSQVVA
jgi:transposase-like protein